MHPLTGSPLGHHACHHPPDTDVGSCLFSFIFLSSPGLAVSLHVVTDWLRVARVRAFYRSMKASRSRTHMLVMTQHANRAIVHSLESPGSSIRVRGRRIYVLKVSVDQRGAETERSALPISTHISLVSQGVVQPSPSIFLSLQPQGDILYHRSGRSGNDFAVREC